MLTKEDHHLCHLLLHDDATNVQLGLQLLDHQDHPDYFARVLGLVEYCGTAVASQACRRYLERNLPDAWAVVQKELQLLDYAVETTVRCKERYLQLLGHFEKASDQYRAYFEINPRYGQLLYDAIVEKLQHCHDVARAADYNDQLLAWFPQKADYWYQSVQLHEEWEPTQCLNHLLKATTCSDAQPLHYYELALFYWQHDQLDQHSEHTYKWLQHTLSLAANYAPAHCLLGDWYATQHQWQQAKAAYKKALQQDSKNALYLNRFATSLLATQDSIDDAFAHSSGAVSCCPEEWLYWTTHALCGWLYQKDSQKALSYLAKASNSKAAQLARQVIKYQNPHLLSRYYAQYLEEVIYP